jgi:oligopeptide/dipeptide ABC transporter ATP-binding protein
VPRLDEPRREKLHPIPGQPPDLSRLPPGCAFAPRCTYAVERCVAEAPRLERVGADHLASCWMADKLDRVAEPAAPIPR